MVFNFSKPDDYPDIVKAVEAAISDCRFDYTLLKPQLPRSRKTIEVSFATKSELNGALGTFNSYNGTIKLASDQGEQTAAKAFIAEGAHAVDAYYLGETQRKNLYLLMHPDMPEEDLSDHVGRHPWFGGDEYARQVGEAFMIVFAEGYSSPAYQFDTKLFDPHAPTGKPKKIRSIIGGVKSGAGEAELPTLHKLRSELGKVLDG